jgi:hypothetical protein
MAMRLGPFEPEIAYPGRIDDTRALEAWIPQILTGHKTQKGI